MLTEALSQLLGQAALGAAPQSPMPAYRSPNIPALLPGGGRMDLLPLNEQIAAAARMRENSNIANASQSADAMVNEILGKQRGAYNADPSNPMLGPRARFFAERGQAPDPLPQNLRVARDSKLYEDIVAEAEARKKAYVDPFSTAQKLAAKARQMERDAATNERWKLVSNNAADRQGKRRPFATGDEMFQRQTLSQALENQLQNSGSQERLALTKMLFDQQQGDKTFERQMALADRGSANQLAMLREQLAAADKAGLREDARLQRQESRTLSPWQQSMITDADRALAFTMSPDFKNLDTESQRQYVALANNLLAQKQSVLAGMMPAGHGGALSAGVGAGIGGGASPPPVAPAGLQAVVPKKPGWMEAEQAAKQAEDLIAKGVTPEQFFQEFRVGDGMQPEIVQAALKKWTRPEVEQALSGRYVEQKYPWNDGVLSAAIARAMYGMGDGRLPGAGHLVSDSLRKMESR